MIKLIKNILFGGTFLLNLVAVFLLLLAVLSPYVNPNRIISLSFLGISFPLWVLLNLFFVVYWLLRSRWCFLLSCVALFLSAHEIVNYCPLHRRTDPLPENTIKFMSYNCMAFLDMNKNAQKEDNLVNYINKCDADIVCLQEYAFSASNKRSNVDKLNGYFSKYPYTRFLPLPGAKNGTWGIACLSRFPIVKVERIPYGSYYNQSAAFTIRLNDGREVIVINNHLESNKLNVEDKALYANAVTTLDPKLIKGVRTTLFGKLAAGYRARSAQADSVRQYIDRHQGKNMIVCGDFNDTQVSYAYRTIRGNLCDAFGGTGFGLGITYHEDYFLFRIDHILHSPSIKSYNCKIDKVKYSDHYPVLCYFSIPLKEK